MFEVSFFLTDKDPSRICLQKNTRPLSCWCWSHPVSPRIRLKMWNEPLTDALVCLWQVSTIYIHLYTPCFKCFGKMDDMLHTLGVAPSQCGKWRFIDFYRNPTSNCKVILVVTVTERGPIPLHVFIILHFLPQSWKSKIGPSNSSYLSNIPFSTSVIMGERALPSNWLWNLVIFAVVFSLPWTKTCFWRLKWGWSCVCVCVLWKKFWHPFACCFPLKVKR